MTLPRCTREPEGAAAEAARAHRAVLPVLETPRLRLRAPEIGDFPLWARIFAGPGPELIGGALLPGRASDHVCSSAACWLLHGHGPFTLVRESDGAGLGFVFLGDEWDDEEPALGWFPAPEARGHDSATEAARAVCDTAASARLGTGIWRHGEAA